MNSNDLFGDTIYVYTRAQAIEDGVLIDVSEVAREAGFRLPVVVTSAVWEQYISWSAEDSEKQAYQDESGRLWDVLWMLRVAASRCREQGVMFYELYVIRRNGRSRKPIKTQLKAVIGGGDQGEPVITIMLPTED